MILGTAGHVDHGKTALVKALTGVDTDRLAEEKRRGITIDLGFAPLHLAGGRTLGVVDVPGHEAFVRNMLAGATGVDLALLVVAADEGVMPQTREHLAILNLLGIRGGVVALTKCDLVDTEWLALVRDDLAAALAGSMLAGAEVIATSVVTGAGLAELRDALEAAAAAIPARDADDLFRMPVDRAFTVRGTGTVVTGTVWSGRLSRDEVVQVLPAGRAVRVRGIESHGESAAHALPGTRAAIALAGVEVDQVPRGSLLVTGSGWRESKLLLAEVALLPDAPRALGARTQVRFHLGTAECGARVVTPGGPLPAGGRAAVRLVLDRPLAARAGDRFVLRAASGAGTIGGGVVADPLPPHRRSRPWTALDRSAEERLRHLLDASGAQGVDVASLPLRLGISPAAANRLIAEDPAHRVIGARVYGGAELVELAARALAVIDAGHARAPLEPGVPLQHVRAALGVEPAVAEVVMAGLLDSAQVAAAGALVSRAGWRPSLEPAQSERMAGLVQVLEAAGREPPSVIELEAAFGADTSALLRHLERSGRVRHVESERYYSAGAVDALLADLARGMRVGRAYTPAELKDLLRFSRKYLIPFLEYCDRQGYTERCEGGRVLGVVPA